MQITVLASGSSGNALIVSSAETSLIVDAGISARRVADSIAGSGIASATLAAVLVTHEHSDHISGLGPIARRFDLPVLASEGTHASLDGRLGTCRERVVVGAGRRLTVGDLAVTPFSVSHDSAEPVGYSITDGRHRVAIATDLGVVGRSVRHHLELADCVVFEFNHDERMLIDGSYPWPLKRRIMSNIGHLSNGTAARELERLAEGPMSTLILAHLSRENNEPGLALEAASEVLGRAGRADVSVHVAPQSEWLGPIEIGRGRTTRSTGEREGVPAGCTR